MPGASARALRLPFAPTLPWERPDWRGDRPGGGGRDECPRPAPGVTAVGLPGRPRILLPGPLAGPGWRWGDAAASQPPGSGGRAGTSLPGCGSHLTQSRGTRGSISPNLGYSWKSILFKSAGGLIYRMALRILLTYKHFKNTLRFFPSSPALFLKRSQRALPAGRETAHLSPRAHPSPRGPRPFVPKPGAQT